MSSVEDKIAESDADNRTVAAVDLGSNSFHLIVARLENGVPRIVDRHREMVRLADGLDSENMLTAEARWRALGCLNRFGERLRGLSSKDVRAVGTNTFRAADNTTEFLAEAEQALGHPIDIVSGIEEARLIYQGVVRSMDSADEKRLVVDIGGGSTELIVGQGKVAGAMNSFYMGCVSMSRQFFADGDITEERMLLAETAARQELEPFQEIYNKSGWDVALGASGTIKAAARIAFENGWSDDKKVINKRGLKHIRKMLIELGHVDKLEMKGLVEQRIPVICGGVAILRAIFGVLGIDSMRATSGALREGLLYDLVGRLQHHDVRDHSVNTLAQRCNIDMAQADRVSRIALDLFDMTSAEWKITGDDMREMLGWAARLHECGMMVAYNQYHKHGAYIITNANMHGFSQQEQGLLAMLVRAHRRKFPNGELRSLPGRWARQAQRLAILLRVAVTLCRGRSDTTMPGLEAAAGKNSLNLKIPGDWLDFHPLTRADLASEAGYLKGIDYSLKLTS